MLVRRLVKPLAGCVRWLIDDLNERYKQWTKPDMDSLATGTLMDVTRSKRDLIAENAFLRQQLIVLKRQTPRPSLTPKDRFGNLIGFAVRDKEFLQPFRRYVSRNIIGKTSLASFLNGLIVNVSGEYLGFPFLTKGTHPFSNQDGYRVSFFTGGTARHPYPDGLVRLPALEQVGNNVLVQTLEYFLITKETGDANEQFSEQGVQLTGGLLDK
jgi:hypothetical protein